jgi:hypothetical protein
VALIHRGRLEIHDSRHPSPLLLAQIPRSPVEAVLVARGTDAVTPGVAISRSASRFHAPFAASWQLDAVKLGVRGPGCALWRMGG